MGFPAGVNFYRYVANNPANAVDRLGTWQVTITFGVGPGGIFTMGNNGGTGLFNGQWNGGFYAGVGEGFAMDLDVFDRGCHEHSINYGIQASGEIGLGPLVEGEAHEGPESWWNISAGLQHTPYGASVGTDGITVPTVGGPEGAAVGLGATIYGSTCGCGGK